jgi:hypothetical protein
MNLPVNPRWESLRARVNASAVWLRLHYRKIMQIVSMLGLVSLVIVIVYQVIENWSTIISYPWQLQWKDLLIGFFIYVFNLLLTATNWGLILNKISGNRKPMLTHWRLYSISNLANRLPTPLPWIGARVEAYSNLEIPRSATLMAMSIDLIAMLVAATIIALVTSPFGPHELVSQNLIPFVVIVLIGIILVSLRPKWLFKFFNWFIKYFHRTPVTSEVSTISMLSWIGIYVIIWCSTGMLYYLISTSIYPMPIYQLMLILNICTISGVIGWIGQIFFFVPNLALRQIALASLLSLVIPWPVAVADTLFLRFIIMVYEVISAMFFYLLGYFLARQSDQRFTLLRRKK